MLSLDKWENRSSEIHSLIGPQMCVSIRHISTIAVDATELSQGVQDVGEEDSFWEMME